MNSIGQATNERVGMAALRLIMLTLFLFTAETTVPLQAQTDPADAKVPAVMHNSWSSGAAMPTALKFAMTGVIGGKVYVVGGRLKPLSSRRTRSTTRSRTLGAAKQPCQWQPATAPVPW
jgi:hypothetical protein